MITLKEAAERIGNGVVYSAKERYFSKNGTKHERVVGLEDGVITSVNDRYVFVRYRGDFGSKATDPKDLEFLT